MLNAPCQHDGCCARLDFHKWRLTRRLHAEVFTKDPALWAEAMAAEPTLLHDLFDHVGAAETATVTSEQVRSESHAIAHREY